MNTNEPKAASAHRPTVRILEPRVNWRGAIATLSVTATAGALLLLMLHLWRAEDTTQAYQRSLGETELDWRCANGHAFRAVGQVDPRQCSQCKQNAWPVAQFACPTHGPFEVALKYQNDEHGKAHVVGWRITGQDWMDSLSKLVCPTSKCGKQLQRPRVDPLAGAARGKEKSGGA